MNVITQLINDILGLFGLRTGQAPVATQQNNMQPQAMLTTALSQSPDMSGVMHDAQVAKTVAAAKGVSLTIMPTGAVQGGPTMMHPAGYVRPPNSPVGANTSVPAGTYIGKRIITNLGATDAQAQVLPIPASGWYKAVVYYMGDFYITFAQASGVAVDQTAIQSDGAFLDGSQLTVTMRGNGSYDHMAGYQMQYLGKTKG